MSNYYGSIRKQYLLGALEEFKETTTEKIEYNKWRSFVKFFKEELKDGNLYHFKIEGDVKFTLYTQKGTFVVAGSKQLMDIILNWTDGITIITDTLTKRVEVFRNESKRYLCK